VEEKLVTLKDLLDRFTPEEKDAILEIVTLALQVIHPSASE